MAIVRWEPTRELNTLQGEMNRLFNAFFEIKDLSFLRSYNENSS